MHTNTNALAQQSAPTLKLSDTEVLLQDFNLQICLIVDEKSRIISAASRQPTPALQRLAEVAPTMALLPECRALHTEYINHTCGSIDDADITSIRFDIVGRRFFLAAVGPDAARLSPILKRALFPAR